jgi:hypothetical protein
VGLEDVGKVLADDVAARRAKDVADEEDVHLFRIARGLCRAWRGAYPQGERLFCCA